MSKETNETKICKHCKSEIPAGAKICPHCRKKQGGILKWVIIALIVIVILGAIAGGGDDDKKSDTNKKSDNQTEQNDGNNNADSDVADDNETDDEEEYLTVGSSFEKRGLKITVNEASTDFQDYKNEYGWNTPDEGMKYVMVSFTFENNSDSDAYVSIYDFDCYADNTACDQVYSLDDSSFINTNLSSGRNTSFKTYYAVPINAQSIELEYEMNAWTGEKVVIKLQ